MPGSGSETSRSRPPRGPTHHHYLRPPTSQLRRHAVYDESRRSRQTRFDSLQSDVSDANQDDASFERPQISDSIAELAEDVRWLVAFQALPPLPNVVVVVSIVVVVVPIVVDVVSPLSPGTTPLVPLQDPEVPFAL